jgi:hypothetical protein
VLVAGYQTKLADLEARIQAIAPELQLPARHRSPNPRQSYQANKRRGSSPTEALFKHFDHPR